MDGAMAAAGTPGNVPIPIPVTENIVLQARSQQLWQSNLPLEHTPLMPNMFPLWDFGA